MLKYLEAGECWEAEGREQRSGHIKIGHDDSAHRLVYFWYYPLADKTLQVQHTCDNPPCIRDIHLKLGTNKDNVKDRQDRNRQSKGEGRPSSKLTEDDVKEMRGWRKLGYTYKSIAELYGVSESAAHRAINKKKWGHVR